MFHVILVPSAELDVRLTVNCLLELWNGDCAKCLCVFVVHFFFWMYIRCVDIVFHSFCLLRLFVGFVCVVYVGD